MFYVFFVEKTIKVIFKGKSTCFWKFADFVSYSIITNNNQTIY